ncbi:MAG: DNA-processing protein DprA [Candidatus Obscuribacterales bacterium]
MVRVSPEDEHFSQEDLSYWLAFDSLTGAGVGIKKVLQLIERFGSIKEAWQAAPSELRDVKGFGEELVASFNARRKEIDPGQLLESFAGTGVTALPYAHSCYPARLRHIDNPPVILYMKGGLAPEDLRAALAVVGTRKPSAYGSRLAKQFSHDLAASGVTIVSGMAVGIDSLAHWGALEARGKSVAVLACGVDMCYPPTNQRLYNKLIQAEHGAVVSEFFPGTKPERWRFPARNRIIAGMSDGILVVEAGEKSGALITAEIGFVEGRQVFAIPGNIDSRTSAGTNSLICNLKAQAVTDYQRILKELDWETSYRDETAPTIVELFGREKEIFEMLSAEPVHFDYLSQMSGMGAGELSATLTMLELAGIVTRHPGEWFSRAAVAEVLQ